jgi:hypothetical protein
MLIILAINFNEKLASYSRLTIIMKIVNKMQGLTNRELATVFMHPKFDGGHSKPLFYNIIVFVSNPA